MNNWWFICIALIIEIVLYSFFIKVFKKQKIGQSIRKEGPKSHINKKGTPTMGGLIFGVLILIGYLLGLKLINEPINIYPTMVIIVTILGYGVLGFLDDYLIVIKHNNDGISPTIKFIVQIIIAVVIFFILLNNNHSTVINIFGVKFDFTFVYGLFIIIFLSGTTNAVNLTDGLDGLASGLLIIAFIGTLVLGLLKENLQITLYSSCLIASLLAFLIFNFNPAKIFMGNAGSLMFGSILATQFVLLEEEMMLLIIAFVFIIETLSVIIQVTYFKITKGKRIFLMAPLHHHYEKKGNSEVMVDLLFWIFGLLALMMLLIAIL